MPADLTPADVRRIVGRDDAVILEIGCNEGDDTEGFVREFPRGAIHCFECDRRAINKWHARQVANNWHSAYLHTCAIGDACGAVDFYPSDGTPPGERWKGYGDHWDKSGSLLPNDHHTDYAEWLRFSEPVKVPCLTLDRWAASILPTGTIDFAWVDVQGFEAGVLRGGQQTLRRIDWAYAECHSLPFYKGQATLAELDALLPGFTRVGQWGENYLWKREG